MNAEIRRSGIDIIGDVPWGSHFCQFYRTAEDLLDVLVPYFAAGLGANEFCMWITSEPVGNAAAEKALAAAVPDLARHLREKRIEIIPHDQWYLAGGTFDADRVLAAWARKLEEARARGFEGLRLTGNTFWLEKKDWQAFTDYEAAVDDVIGQRRMLALCTYSLERCGANEVLDVIRNHRFAMARREGHWELVESAELARARQTERRLAQFPQQNPYPVLRIGEARDLLYANAPALKLLASMGPQESGALPAALEDLVARAFGQGGLIQADLRDGTGRTYWLTAVRPPGESYVNLYALDVTARATAEQALRESEAKYRLLFEAMTEGFALYELIDDEAGQPVDWRVLEVNEAYTRHTGLPREEVVGRRISEMFPISVEEYLPTFAKVVETGEPVEFETHAKAVGRYQRVATFPAGGRRFANLIEDITARRRAEEALRASEGRYRVLFDNMSEGLAVHEIITDDEGRPVDYRFLDVNPAFERLTGLRREEILGRTVREVLKDIEPFWIETYGRVALTGEPIQFERYYPAPLNRWYEIHAYSPAPRRFATVFMDITRRKQAEALRQALDEQERLRLGAAVELAEEAVVMAQPDGRILYVNAAFEKIHRLAKQDALGRNFFDLVASDPQAVGMRRALAPGRAWNGRLVLNRPGERPVELTLAATPIQDPPGLLITEQDVTQRVLLEDQVRQAQKMESLGTLAGGIAHDFNNILGAIVINTELALMNTEESCPARESLPLVLKAAERGKDMVRQIVTFSRQQDWEKSVLPVAPVVREALKLLEATLPAGVTLHASVAADKALVLGNPSHIHQIITNLCRNAALAMKDCPGSLDVRLDTTQVDEATAARHAGLKPGPYVRLAVADAGCGMAREVQDRVFEPFFTTRSHGEGSGLGLSVVHGIVKNFGGAITVYSEVGKGSTFTVFLPLVGEGGEQAEVPAGPAAEPGSESVLLVDDDQAQLESLSRMLEKLGYRVTTRTSGRDAEEAFLRDPAAFDLVITDQTMPGKTGIELARSLSGVRPDLPIILNTGFSEKVNGETVGRDGIRAFLMKPFTTSELSALIRRVLTFGR